MLKKVSFPTMFLCILVLTTLSVLPVCAQPGDVNGDSTVDITDICIIARAYGTNSIHYPWGTGWDQYNPAADIYPTSGPDGYIDMNDLNLAVSNFGSGVTALTPQPQSGPTWVEGPTPPPIFVSANTYFNVAIEISGVSGLSQYQFMLSWNSVYIEYVSVTEGPFLSQGGTYQTWFAYKDTYLPMNRLLVGCSLLEPVTTSGSGVLATVTFRCKQQTTGMETIHLVSNLYDININGIDHHDKNVIVKQTP